jgi:predicted nucleic acid-binding protein
MSNAVVDSSVVVKWVLAEEDSEQAERFLTDVMGDGGQLIILDLALIETTNAVWKRHHRGLIDLAEARRYVRDLLTCPLQINSSSHLLDSALQIAAKYDHAVYDALFVALARELGSQGVTADEPLWRSVHADFPNIVLLREWKG